jgi:cardiolipin synthase
VIKNRAGALSRCGISVVPCRKSECIVFSSPRFPFPGSPPSGLALSRGLSRIAGSDARSGNAVGLLEDARETYPAWLGAIRSARRTVDFENFIIADDETGRVFAEALIERARAGLRVRVLYDWLGCFLRSSGRFWRALREAGVEVRAFNAPAIGRPDWFRRDHRKILITDGTTGFVSGLCVSDCWKGRRKGADPWRDTGIVLRGPAVADLAAAFDETWAASGPETTPRDPFAAAPERGEPAGDATACVVAGRPGEQRTYRLDLLTAACARDRLWITDAYFVPTGMYRKALIEAAQEGVDVRLLVPGKSDVPLLPALIRSGYRPLLEAGVRIFEWNGTMLHAKTAVIDGRLARVGSTNLNPTSWFGNHEIDVLIDDKNFAGKMDVMFLRDLAGATEILPAWRAGKAGRSMVKETASAHGSVDLAVSLNAIEIKALAVLAVLLTGIAVLVTAMPSIVVSLVVITCLWFAGSIVSRLIKQRRGSASASRRTMSHRRGGQNERAFRTFHRGRRRVARAAKRQDAARDRRWPPEAAK